MKYCKRTCKRTVLLSLNFNLSKKLLGHYRMVTKDWLIIDYSTNHPITATHINELVITIKYQLVEITDQFNNAWKNIKIIHS